MVYFNALVRSIKIRFNEIKSKKKKSSDFVDLSEVNVKSGSLF